MKKAGLNNALGRDLFINFSLMCKISWYVLWNQNILIKFTKLTRPFFRNSKDLVYVIECSVCDEQYTGFVYVFLFLLVCFLVHVFLMLYMCMFFIFYIVFVLFYLLCLSSLKEVQRLLISRWHSNYHFSCGTV